MPEIRPMRESDLNEVLRIERLSFSQPWPEEAFAETGHTNSWVICAEDNPLGYIMYHSVLDEGVIINFAIDPAHRQQGLGTDLLRSTLGYMKDSGVTNFFLDVRVSNVAAQKLYHRFGFQPLGFRRKYYSLPDEDALVMVMSLGDITE